MPITPYNTPVQYQYKPLGLEAFAAPLSQMQQRFDIDKAAIDAEDFNLSHLPYGTDPKRAKELLGTVKAKRDELATSLLETKNFREAEQKLLQLRKLWKEDPETLAIQSNYNQFQQLDKEQKERASKGEITRDQYLEWKDRTIGDYTNKGATAFKATNENREGEYNRIGYTPRLKDLSTEIEKIKLEIAKAQPEKVGDIFDMYGIPISEEDRVHIKTTWKGKSQQEIEKETEAYLRKYPGFSEWASEVADYSLYNQKKNPEKYQGTAKELVSGYLKDASSYLKKQEEAASKGNKDAKKYLESDSYKALKDVEKKMNDMIITGNYDDNIVQNLYTEQHLDKVFDSKEVSDILAYKNVTKDYQFRKIGDGSGSGKDKDEDLGMGFFTPSDYEKFDISDITKQRVQSGKALYTTASNINNIAGGVMRTAVMGPKGSKIREEMAKDPAAMRERSNQILSAASSTIANGGSSKDFYSRIRNLGVDEQTANTLYKEFTKPGGYALQKLKTEIEKSDYDFNNYVNAKDYVGNINAHSFENKNFRAVLNEIGNDKPQINAGINTLTPEMAKQQRLFSPNSYTKEQLTKIGINADQIPNYGSGRIIGQKYNLSFDQIAKLRGYKDYADAVEKGYNFEGAYAANFKDNEIFKNPASSTSTTHYNSNDVVKVLQQQLLDQGLIKNEMSYRYINDGKVDNVISKFFLQAPDLANFQPAYSSTHQNNPGFDEEGKLLPTTQLDITKTTMPKLVKHGNSIYFEVPIKYKDEDGNLVKTTTVIKPKKGTELTTERLLNRIDETTNTDDPLDKQSNDMVKVMKFDQRFSTNFSNTLAKSVNIGDSKGSQTTISTVPFGVSAPGTNIEIVKVATGNGDYTMKVAINTNGERVFVPNPETGKDFYSHDADAVKAFIAKQMGL